MINNLLKNFCLITFALIAPVTLPAGGIQKSLNQNQYSHNTNEIILSSNTSLYSFPEITSKGCRTFFPLENKKDEEIKRLRKIIRRLRKQNKG